MTTLDNKSIRSKQIWKIFNLSVGFSTAAIYLYIIYLIAMYMSHPTIISHTLEHKPFVWPQVTICNPTAPFLMRHSSNEYKYWNGLISRSKQSIQKMDDRLVFGRTDFKNQLVFAMSSADREKLFNVSNMELLFSIDYDLLFPNSVRWVYRDIEVIPTSFVQFIDNIPCYTIDINNPKIEIRKSNLSDENGQPKLKWESVDEISLHLMIGYESYKLFNSSIEPRSINLYLSNENELSRVKTIVTPEIDTTLFCTENNYQYLGLKNKCRRDKFKIDLYDPFLSSTKLYEGNYKDCVQVAIQELSVTRCNCYDPLLPIYKNESGFPRLCVNLTMFNESEMRANLKCLATVSSDIYQDLQAYASFIFGKCEKYRVQKCEFRSYKVQRRDSMFVKKQTKVFHQQSSRKFDKDIKKLRYNNVTIKIVRNSEYSELHREDEKYSAFQFWADVFGMISFSISLFGGLFKVAKMCDKKCENDKTNNNVLITKS